MRRGGDHPPGPSGKSPRVSMQSPNDGVIRQRAPLETPVQQQCHSTLASEEVSDDTAPSPIRWMEDRPNRRRQTWNEACSPSNMQHNNRAPRAVLAMFNGASSAAKVTPTLTLTLTLTLTPNLTRTRTRTLTLTLALALTRG